MTNEKIDQLVNLTIAFIVIAFIFIGIYISSFLPCKYFGWSAITSVPARCIELKN